MPVAATGIFQDLTMMRELVAASSTFQGLVPVLTAAEAKERIHLYAAVDDIHPLPRCIVSPRQRRRIKVGERNCFRPQTIVEIAFELIVPEYLVAQNEFDEAITFVDNKIGGIIADMEALEGTGEPVTGLAHLSVEMFDEIASPFLEISGVKRLAPNPDAGLEPVEVWNSVWAAELN